MGDGLMLSRLFEVWFGCFEGLLSFLVFGVWDRVLVGGLILLVGKFVLLFVFLGGWGVWDVGFGKFFSMLEDVLR